jgi:cholesterol 24(S)-hydroxylase
MKLDTVNNPEDKFNEYVFESLSGLKHYFVDPLIKLKPHKWSFINKHRHAIRCLRKTGRDQIMERLEMIKKGQELPKDILTTILISHGNIFFLSVSNMRLNSSHYFKRK